MNLFYHPSLEPGKVGSVTELDSEESGHCIRVLRKRTGDLIHLADGKGSIYEGRVESEDARRCAVLIQQVTTSTPPAVHLHIAIAPTKSIDRFEWFLEKATEIGISEITPLRCDHSERTVLKTDRQQKILVSAMKQSGNLYLPRLNEMTGFTSFLSTPFQGQKFIGYAEERQPVHLKSACSPGTDVLVLIGPEGDFSTEELKQASSNHYLPISLGTPRFRTETAGLVACMVVQLLNS